MQHNATPYERARTLSRDDDLKVFEGSTVVLCIDIGDMFFECQHQ
jgi:hypothetical protein